jgi:hypothetical protein
VIIINLVAGKTREGRVLKTLLEKLEAISHELGRDKVFDVVGRTLEGMSLQDYMEQALTEEGAAAAVADIAWRLTSQRFKAIEAEDRAAYGAPDDPRTDLPDQQARQAVEQYRRLLPGHVRHFIEQAAPRLGYCRRGELGRLLCLTPRWKGAMDEIWRVRRATPLSIGIG